MKTTNKTLIYKSTPEYYSLEKSNRKANTIRIETAEELQRIRTQFIIGNITTIRVINTVTNQYFERQITDISRVGNIAGHSMIVISWKQEGETNNG